ncbi:9983_t:CDS:2 [Entrophospora sp. SA101]|nr:3877_t:CDS:2 [Entrophospora sp. SA101]CAJ0824120.1 7966_t:CDS:2 [Entrophospora sp. SA101]CAJ0827530.1 9983_t:CDS:2 [Entrophospora sp. SA101]CAJ0858694.1 8167_t:CDS:2 [Entrophospora sp. SA101]
METYFGYVKSPQDAILLFEACRVGFLSRIQRRLSDKERSSIRSGSVFVWDEREAGMRRWTDGKSWSASRVSGSFLTYRELESKRKSSSRGNNNPHDLSSEDTDSSESYHSSSTAKKVISTEQCRYKHGGLVKQSFSITTTTHQKLHLICYYTKADVIQEKLPIPIHDEKLKSIVIPKGMYPETTNILDSNNLNNNNGIMINSGNNRSPSPYAWQYQQLHSSSNNTPNTASSYSNHHNNHFHRPSVEPMQIDSHSACSTPSISSSPSTTSDDFPNFATIGNNNNNGNNVSGGNGINGVRFNFFNHSGSSTASLPLLYPSSNYAQSSDNNGYGNGSEPINIPNASSRSNFPNHLPFPASYPPRSSVLNSNNNGHNGNSDNSNLLDQQQQSHLPPQDIPWEKIRNSEDQRQLNAIYTTLKL